MHFSHNNDGKIELEFQVNNKTERAQSDIVVGADGIRSVVRELLMGKEVAPLCYTGYVVILGICHFNDITDTQSSLLD